MLVVRGGGVRSARVVFTEGARVGAAGRDGVLRGLKIVIYFKNLSQPGLVTASATPIISKIQICVEFLAKAKLALERQSLWEFC